MMKLNRTTTVAACAAAMALCGGAAVVAQTAGDDAKKQDREKIEKELQDLQEQRSKLDSRIRELRRQAGRDMVRSFTFGDGNVQTFTLPNSGSFYFSDGKLKEMKELTPEQRKRVEEAMAEARKALEKVKKDLPEGFVMPDVQGLLNNSMRFYTAPPNGAWIGPNAFDSKEFKEQMEKMKDTIRKNVETYRMVVPRVQGAPGTTVIPALPGAPAPPATLFRGNNPELRDEIRELRRELEQLREEMRRDRGGKADRKTGLFDPFDGTL